MGGVVALGGGHGLSATLRALRRVTPELTAVVTVTDDGGSSGRLRRGMGVLPPGDLRMALCALAGEDTDAQVLAAVMQHRFDAGDVTGHVIGNMFLTGTMEVTGDAVAALALAGRTLGLPPGMRVLPLSRVPLVLLGDMLEEGTDEGVVVAGQTAVRAHNGRTQRVRVLPEDAPGCEEAVAAILDAEWVVLGPGSWFTSVLPHLAVPDVREALEQTSAHKLVVMNLQQEVGETSGLDPHHHLEALEVAAPHLTVDHVLVDRATPGQEGLEEAADDLGARLHVCDVRSEEAGVHDPEKLAAAYAAIMGSCELAESSRALTDELLRAPRAWQRSVPTSSTAPSGA